MAEPVERRFEPGPDIRPLTLQEFDKARTYLRLQVDTLGPMLQHKHNIKDKAALDDAIKGAILQQADCPPNIKTLAEERPSVFDILCSTYRYRAELIEVQRNMLMQMEKGRVSEKEAYYNVFMKTHPNSQRIIADLQREALEKNRQESKLNLQ